jgi:hypothetical protein
VTDSTQPRAVRICVGMTDKSDGISAYPSGISVIARYFKEEGGGVVDVHKYKWGWMDIGLMIYKHV